MAFAFKGSAFVQVEETSTLDLGPGDFTIDLWVNFDSLATDQTLFDRTVPTFPNSQTFLVEFDIPSSLRFLVRDTTSNQNDLVVDVPLEAGVWYHVAAVRSGGVSTLYLDGIEIGMRDAGAAIDVGEGGQTTIGRQAELAQRYVRGRIDELRIFGRALSSAEIAAAASVTTPTPCG